MGRPLRYETVEAADGLPSIVGIAVTQEDWSALLARAERAEAVVRALESSGCGARCFAFMCSQPAGHASPRHLAAGAGWDDGSEGATPSPWTKDLLAALAEITGGDQ